MAANGRWPTTTAASGSTAPTAARCTPRAIYFTDPPYALPKGWEDERRELDFCGIYRVTPDGVVTLVCDTMTRPNGICLSPDEKRLYVAQSDPKSPLWKVFNVKPDLAGNVFATGPGSVLVFAADGTHLNALLTGQATANCAFGDDGKTLYITADSHLCRTRLLTTGPLPGP